MLETSSPRGSERMRILLATRNQIMKLGLNALIEANNDLICVGDIVDKNELILQSSKLNASLIIIDADCFDEDIENVIAPLFSLQRKPRILILMYAHDAIQQDILALMRLGVRGFAVNTEQPTLLLMAIRTIGLGGYWLSESILGKMISLKTILDTASKQVHLATEEITILRQIAYGKTDQVIATEQNISERTLRYRIRNICDKLGVRTRIEAVAQAIWLDILTL